MTNKYKIAVIVPTYNLENIIDRTLTNLSNQKGIEDMQVIVIDDGSSDDTLPIIKSYVNKIPNLIIRSFDDPSGGASRARNLGISLANSEYLSFLDGDDYYGENALWYAYEHMKYANANIGDPRGIFENRGSGIKYPDELVHYDYDIINDRQYKVFGVWKFYSTKLIQENHINFNEDIHVGEDRVFNAHAYIHSENKVIALYDRDYFHLTGGEGHEHVTDRLPNNSINDIYDFFKEILQLTSEHHEGVDDEWLYKFKMAFVDKTQANKWHYKILTNPKLSYSFRDYVFSEGKRILLDNLCQEDLNYLKENFPRWAWFSDIMMNHDYSFFIYVYKNLERISGTRNYSGTYILDGNLMVDMGKKIGQYISINIGFLDSIMLKVNNFLVTYQNKVEYDLVARSRLSSDEFSTQIILTDLQGSEIVLNNKTDLSKILFSAKDSVYFVQISIEKNGYRLLRKIKESDLTYNFEELFYTVYNNFDGKMRVHFYLSGVKNLKVRVKKID